MVSQKGAGTSSIYCVCRCTLPQISLTLILLVISRAGAIPAELSNLTELESLSVRSNILHGKIDRHFDVYSAGFQSRVGQAFFSIPPFDSGRRLQGYRGTCRRS